MKRTLIDVYVWLGPTAAYGRGWYSIERRTPLIEFAPGEAERIERDLATDRIAIIRGRPSPMYVIESED